MAKKIEKTKEEIYYCCIATKKRIKKLDEVEKVGGKIIVAYISDVEKSGDSYIKAAGSDAFIKLKEALYPSENKL